MTHTKGKWEVDIRTGCFAIYTGEHINCLAGVKESAIVYQNGRGKLSRKYDGYKLLTKEQIANANRIVHCVNVHDEMLEALKNVVSLLNNSKPEYPEYISQFTIEKEKLEQAIKHAEEGL